LVLVLGDWPDAAVMLCPDPAAAHQVCLFVPSGFSTLHQCVAPLRLGAGGVLGLGGGG
jgi:hypothetical protein